MPSDFPRRIKEIRLSLGLSQARFAEALGVSGAYIAQLEGSSKAVTLDILLVIERQFAVEGLADAWYEEKTGRKILSTAAEIPSRRARSVPVIGWVEANPLAGDLFTEQGRPVHPDSARRVSLMGAGEGSLYALEVRNDSMFPRYLPGELVVVDPDGEARLGDDVVVGFHDGAMMLKHLRDQQGELLVFASVNAKEYHPLLERLDNIRWMHRVIARINLSLPGRPLLRPIRLEPIGSNRRKGHR